MLSALILLAIWAVFLNCFLPKTVTKHVTYLAISWGILFACALATSSTIYFIQINALPNLASNKWIIGVESIASLGYLLFGFRKAKLASKLVIPFKDEDEVILMANSTDYGLSASIFTENVSRAHRVAAKIKSGIVWINTWMLRDLRIPFGGMKQSGVGREGGFKSLQFFTEPKNVCLKI